MRFYTGLVHGKPGAEESYVNVLLTTLAKGPASVVALMPGISPPSLSSFARDADEQDWIDSYHFNYEQLDGTKIVSLILTLAVYRFYHFYRTDYTLKAILALLRTEQDAVSVTVKRQSR